MSFVRLITPGEQSAGSKHHKPVGYTQRTGLPATIERPSRRSREQPRMRMALRQYDSSRKDPIDRPDVWASMSATLRQLLGPP